MPPCPYFGRCGGCVLQHMAIPPYAAWKRARLAEALMRAGHDGAGLIAEPAVTPPQTRRRADLALRREQGVPVLGFHARASGAVVDLETCVVLDPALVEPQAPALPQVLPGQCGRPTIADRVSMPVRIAGQADTPLYLQ